MFFGSVSCFFCSQGFLGAAGEVFCAQGAVLFFVAAWRKDLGAGEALFVASLPPGFHFPT